MNESKCFCMKTLSIKVKAAVTAAIDSVTKKRMTYMTHVHTNLVSTSGLEPALDICEFSKPFNDVVMCYRIFSMLIIYNSHLFSVRTASSDISFNNTFIINHVIPNYGMI